jgi:hypothetical protein
MDHEFEAKQSCSKACNFFLCVLGDNRYKVGKNQRYNNCLVEIMI